MFRKTLIPISYLPAADETLRWGARLIRRLHSDLTLLYVVQSKQRGPLDASVTQEKMTEWGVEPPNFRLLREAEDVIKAEGAIQLDARGLEVERHSFKALSQGTYEVHLHGVQGENIRLRLRDGAVVSQILKEVEDPGYDLIFIGTRGQRGFRKYLLGNIAHDVASNAPCSVLVAKHLDLMRGVLVGVTGRESSIEAIHQGVALALALSLPIQLISIHAQPDGRDRARANLEMGMTTVRRLKQDAEPLLVEGDSAKALIQTAGTDHLLVLGRSPMSLVQRVFLGDISLRILNQGKCSVLIATPSRWVEDASPKG